MKHLLLLGLMVTCGITPVFSQIGGHSVYSLPALPSSARVTALGGSHISTMDKDITLAAENPALLNPEMDEQVAFSGSDYLGDSKFGQAAYARHFEGTGTFMASMNFLQYGNFQRADRFGNQLGEFTAAEYNLKVAGSRKMDKISMGWAVNFLYGHLEQYNSLGTYLDFGATYRDTASLTNLSLVVKNLGTQISSYTEGNREPLPLNVQLAFSKKFAHMPLRLTILGHHLNIPDLTNPLPDDQVQTSLETGDPVNNEPSLGEKIFRHFIVSGELIFSENFHLRLGYNHQRRQTMTEENNKGFVGYSAGLGIQISKFRLSYGRGAYHVAESTNHITISTNLSKVLTKKD